MKTKSYCYMLLCANQAIYTGWTTDVNRRFHQHKIGKGASYTKINSPVELIYWETQKTSKIARKREIALKKMSHLMKTNISHGENSKSNHYEFFVSSPGRVNLLGEHVDYNGGPVLPAAIDRAVSLWANREESQIFRIKTEDLNQEVIFSIDSLQNKIDINSNPLPDWALYPASVIWAANKEKQLILGFDAVFNSTVPIGAGLSSSAALEIAFAALLRELGNWQLDDMQLAKLCQFAENEYVGVNCGIMDQFACANGVDNSALYLDTANLSWYPVELPKNTAIIIADSKIKRSLSNSAYNERRNSCEEAIIVFKETLPNINFLSEISPDQFEQLSTKLSETTFKRAKHVIEECQRVKKAVECLQNKDVNGFGQLMKEGHVSLRDLYEVSLPELDQLVDLANSHKYCFGSRLTGAGFGGCTVSLVQKKHAQKFIDFMKSKYQALSGIVPDIYLCKAREGVRVEWRKLR